MAKSLLRFEGDWNENERARKRRTFDRPFDFYRVVVEHPKLSIYFDDMRIEYWKRKNNFTFADAHLVETSIDKMQAKVRRWFGALVKENPMYRDILAEKPTDRGYLTPDAERAVNEAFSRADWEMGGPPDTRREYKMAKRASAYQDRKERGRS